MELENDLLAKAANKPKPARAISPRLRILLYVVFGIVALLFANSAYLSAITAMEWFSGHAYQNYFYQYMFLGHLVLGFLLIIPFLAFGGFHWYATRKRRKVRAIRIGYALLGAGILVLVTGILLTRVSGFDLKQPVARSVVYWLHVVVPVAAIWLYWLHRLAGPKIKWRVGVGYVGAVAVVLVMMTIMHSEDPRRWNAVGPESGLQYFSPSLARTTSGDFIPAKALMNDQYCAQCHQDVHAGWEDSVHRFSSFNNPAYLASVNETRVVALERDGSVQASRWCAGCHDPVPFFSGKFDDPQFDMLKDASGQAGITCTVCHAVTHVNSNKGNADYTIEEPLHYPFTYSENPVLQWVNRQLVKAKPEFHKQTFLKPFHKTAEFCSTCHKVHLPDELTQYKEFLRGQNHYDSYLISGVSGHGSRSFYYPETAQVNCNGCHMPLEASNDFGAKDFDGTGVLKVHDHLFPSANTGIAWLRDKPDVVARHQKFLEDVTRVDIFGLRPGGEIDSPLIAPLRPESPELVPGQKYLLDVVIRTLKLGHHFTQGTVDSNEIWLEVVVKSGERVIGHSGDINPDRGNEVDPWAHHVNVFMLDKNGNRINRRNAQDIFTPLYNNQIPPGAADTVHYEFTMPEDVKGPVTVEAFLKYRKFDQEYMDFVDKENQKLGAKIRGAAEDDTKTYVNDLPITVLAADTMTFAVEGSSTKINNPQPTFDTWKRWNDYGIGLLIPGKKQLRQAAQAFAEVEKLNRWDGPMNLARTYSAEGRLDDAVAALQRAKEFSDEKNYPEWTWAWLSGMVNREQGNLPEAVNNLRSVVDGRTPEMVRRGFDFSKDYVVLNLLGQTLFDLGSQRRRQGNEEEAIAYWHEAAETFHRTLEVDSENVTAHHNLQRIYAALDEPEKAAEHAVLHERYKMDDTAKGRAVRLAREKYPAANSAAEEVTKYQLQRDESTSPVSVAPQSEESSEESSE